MITYPENRKRLPDRDISLGMRSQWCGYVRMRDAIEELVWLAGATCSRLRPENATLHPRLTDGRKTVTKRSGELRLPLWPWTGSRRGTALIAVGCHQKISTPTRCRQGERFFESDPNRVLDDERPQHPPRKQAQYRVNTRRRCSIVLPWTHEEWPAVTRCRRTLVPISRTRNGSVGVPPDRPQASVRRCSVAVR